ncbi:hypothetical protein MMT14_27935, partial [Escherichia coli]|nr:hypothetical protein [Escherichia coli]
CYTLFRDAYHLAGIDMPDFEREDDWWRNGQNLYLDNMAVTGFYRVPLSSAQAGDILLCCFGASVPNRCAKAAQQDIARLCGRQGNPVKTSRLHIVQVQV